MSKPSTRLLVEQEGHLENASCQGNEVGFISKLNLYTRICFTGRVGALRERKKAREPYESTTGILIAVLEDEYRNRRPMGMIMTATWLNHFRDGGSPTDLEASVY